jgi:quinol monooxygenase YgiN
MYSYQMKIEIKKVKINEFVEFLKSMLSKFREEDGCIDFDLYRDIEKENIYSVIAYWKTQAAMEKHFKNKNFSLLIGSTKVLGESLEMKIGETSENVNLPLALKKIQLLNKG